jgi:protein-tyrosine kinase
VVERLRKAIEKARAQREQVLAGSSSQSSVAVAAEIPADAAAEPRPAEHGRTEPRAPERQSAAQPDSSGMTPALAWAALKEATLDPAHLESTRIVSYRKSDAAHVAFDLLRTRLQKVLKDNRWSRIAITSPTKGCGKTFVAANLALSLARQSDIRTILVDMDLKVPGMAQTLGLTTPSAIEWFLTGQTRPEAFLRRVGRNFAVGVNTERVRDSAELIKDERAAAALARMHEVFKPNAVIFDLPPMLISDDAIAFMPQVDCVLLVAASGQTSPAEIDECERLLGESTNFLGVLLNKCDADIPDSYAYGYYG